jgi:hypothetical protein
MTKNGVDKLHTLLFEEGRELVNIKFLPGTDRGLTPERMRLAAAAAIESVFDEKPKDSPPVSGRKKASLKDSFTVKD